MLALWSCGRRRSVVQAQRQIHRAFAGSYAATYALRHTRHADPPLALPRKIGASRLFIWVSSLSLGVAQLLAPRALPELQLQNCEFSPNLCCKTARTVSGAPSAWPGGIGRPDAEGQPRCAGCPV